MVRDMDFWESSSFFGIFLSMIFIFIYEMSIHGVVAFFNQDYILMVIGAFVLVFIGMIYRGKTCKNKPRGQGRMRKWFG